MAAAQPSRHPARWAVLALCAVVLTGCGFRPLYGERAVQARLAQVAVEPIASAAGQALRFALEDRLDPGGLAPAPLYHLNISLSQQAADLAFTGTGSATLRRVTVTAAYRLSREGEVVMASTAQAQTSYHLLGDHYASVVAARDAFERASRLLADDILAGLARHFRAEAGP